MTKIIIGVSREVFRILKLFQFDSNDIQKFCRKESVLAVSRNNKYNKLRKKFLCLRLASVVKSEFRFFWGLTASLTKSVESLADLLLTMLICC